MLIIGLSSDGTVKSQAGVLSGRRLRRANLRIERNA
jgi:hypothetical protein